MLSAPIQSHQSDSACQVDEIVDEIVDKIIELKGVVTEWRSTNLTPGLPLGAGKGPRRLFHPRR